MGSENKLVWYHSISLVPQCAVLAGTGLCRLPTNAVDATSGFVTVSPILTKAHIHTSMLNDPNWGHWGLAAGYRQVPHLLSAGGLAALPTTEGDQSLGIFWSERLSEGLCVLRKQRGLENMLGISDWMAKTSEAVCVNPCQSSSNPP